MPIFGLIPHVSGDRQELRRAVGPLLRVFYLSFVQVAAMVAVTILFFEREKLASAFYGRFNWLTGYITRTCRTFSGRMEKDRRDGTGWLRQQSTSDRSPPQIPC
jgi:hypothetical protein